ncbi:hypothetical protein [Siccirubricoccus sp. G192]|uniref:hypothetical protein n=1 Tax=Siccirubricoccus sp. G192 TaxID=2849651 RepID=UPI001C2C07BD|nr:hypothetical protein [Siccirubricoccus sp. G192]MBV1796823.1 hypothetical protein [Siccirubricoccus sp. G192]
MAPALPATPAPPLALRAVVTEARAALPPDLAADPLRGPLLALALARAAAPGAEAGALAATIRADFAPAAPAPPLPRRGADPPPAEAARNRSAARPSGAVAGTAVAAAASPVEGWIGTTWHAPLFLLWRDALETGALGHAARLAGGAEAGAAALARTLAGPGADPLADPSIRMLLDLAEDPGPVPPARLTPATLLEALQAETWPPPNPAALVLEALPGEPPHWLLADAATATWLRLSGQPMPGVPGLPLLLGMADAAALGGATQPAGDGRVWLLGGADIPTTLPPLARLPGRLARDAAALVPPGAPDAATALAWAVLGQHVVRRFARRLPGFGHAGLDWLRANMLPETATLRQAEGRDGPRLLVRLDPPPLAPQLRMAGIVPAAYGLPGGAEVVLGFAEG